MTADRTQLRLPRLTLSAGALEVVAAVLMSAAVLLTAYSAYEATRWSGVQATAFTEGSGARTQSVSEQATANAEISYDAIVFGEFAIRFEGALDDPAILQEALQLADLLMRDEFRVALDAWLATDPANNPDAPTTPFQMKEYRNAHQQEALRLQQVAEQKLQQGKDANQTGDEYILATVFFASVLFFAGVSSKFASLRIRAVLLGFASVGLIAGVGRIATLPFQ